MNQSQRRKASVQPSRKTLLPSTSVASFAQSASSSTASKSASSSSVSSSAVASSSAPTPKAQGVNTRVEAKGALPSGSIVSSSSYINSVIESGQLVNFIQKAYQSGEEAELAKGWSTFFFFFFLFLTFSYPVQPFSVLFVWHSFIWFCIDVGALWRANESGD